MSTGHCCSFHWCSLSGITSLWRTSFGVHLKCKYCRAVLGGRWQAACWAELTVARGCAACRDLEQHSCNRAQTVSPGSAGTQIFHTILTAASSKFHPHFFPIPCPQDLHFIHYAPFGAHWIKHIKASARQTGNVNPFLVPFAFFRDVSLHKINGVTPELCQHQEGQDWCLREVRTDCLSNSRQKTSVTVRLQMRAVKAHLQTLSIFFNIQWTWLPILLVAELTCTLLQEYFHPQEILSVCIWAYAPQPPELQTGPPKQGGCHTRQKSYSKVLNTGISKSYHQALP